MSVYVNKPDGNNWLLVSQDSKYLYTEAGASTAFKMGDYSFIVTLSDGFFFGPDSTDYPLSVTIFPKPNSLPYFAAPGLQSIEFELEKKVLYDLPPFADDDGDTVSMTLNNENAPWLLYWLDATHNALIVLEGTTQGFQMLGNYYVSLTLEDDSKYSQPRTQVFNLTVSIVSPDAPKLEGIQTEFVI